VTSTAASDAAPFAPDEKRDTDHITLRPIDGVLSRVTARPGDDHA
jgi:hypothetical protein